METKSSHKQDSYWTTDDVEQRVHDSKVVVFSKGTLSRRLCGYCECALKAIEECGRPFELVDASTDKTILAALREFSGHQMLPVVFVDSELVASQGSIEQKVASRELQERIQRAFSE